MGTPRNPDRPTYGPKIAKVARVLGKPFLPWQAHVSDVAGEVEPDTGRYWYKTIVVHVQRRAGKTVMVFTRHTHRGLTRPAQRMLYGAQSRSEGLGIWDQQILELLSPHLDPLGIKQRKSIGSERLEFPNGSRMELITPTDSVGVGTSTDLVDVDEARFHSMSRGREIESAIKPTQATRDGQLWIPSSAGTFGASDWLWDWIQRGRAALENPESRIAFFDYSVPDDADPSDLDTVCAYHPAIGLTISRDFIAAARDEMDPNDFAREYAGVWTRSVVSVVDMPKWRGLGDAAEPPPQPTAGDVTLGFATTPDRSLTAIGAAWRDSAGVPRVAVLDQRAGAAWFDDRWAELVARWRPYAGAYMGTGPAVPMADRIADHVTLTACNTNDYVVACGTLYDWIEGGTMRHNAQPDLDDAVAAVAKRHLGERWVWGHKASSAPIVALEAVTLAAWAYDHRPARKKTMVVAVA